MRTCYSISHKDRLLYLTPEEVDTDAWYEELKQMLKAAAK